MPPVRSMLPTLVTVALCFAGLSPNARAAGPDSAGIPAPQASALTGRWMITPLRGDDAANAVLMRAISLVGTPYVWGGTTPDGGFDCSGLVNYVFRDMLDMRLPRTSRELAEVEGPRIDLEALQAGDLIFFASNGVISHVGIYVGEGRFIHAPRTGTVVRLEKIDTPYWIGRYSGARRVIQR